MICIRNRAYLLALALAIALMPGAALAQQTIAKSNSEPLKRFPEDLARNAARLWAGDNLAPLLIGAGAATAAIPADDPITRYFENGKRWQGFDPIGRRFGRSQILGPIVAGGLVASRFTHNERYRRFTYQLAQGFVLTNAVTAGIKFASGRERPDQASRYSFPSGHTSNSFLWATVVERTYGRKAGIPAYIFASYVGASRLKSRKHYLTDVVAGATLGYIVGRTVTRDPAKGRSRRVRWNLAAPAGGGVAVSIGFRPGRR